MSVDFFPPVGVLLVEDVDDLAVTEGHLGVVLSGVVVHPDHLAHCWECWGFRRLGWRNFACPGQKENVQVLPG